MTHCVIPTRVLLIKFNLSFFCSNKQILLQDCNCEHNTVTLATLKWAVWWNHQTKAGGTPTSGGGFMQSHSSSSYPHICLFFFLNLLLLWLLSCPLLSHRVALGYASMFAQENEGQKQPCKLSNWCVSVCVCAKGKLMVRRRCLCVYFNCFLHTEGRGFKCSSIIGLGLKRTLVEIQ